VAREITKIYEEFFRGTVSAVLAHYTEHPPRGEIVVLIGGAPEQVQAKWDEAEVRAALREQLGMGVSLKDAAKVISAAAGWERRAVYDLGLEVKNEA
jgi:16S rRNA (cytidine1402-2'-O)-methyltransferase